MGSVFKVIGVIFQVIIAIPKIADVFEKIIEYINAEIDKKRRKDRDKKIKEAIRIAKENNDASALENLLK